MSISIETAQSTSVSLTCCGTAGKMKTDGLQGSEAQNKELLEKLVAIEEEATKEKVNWLQ